MRTGETGLNLINGYEGLRMAAHYAPSEKWTVGYGHTSSARHGMSVTEGDAERLFAVEDAEGNKRDDMGLRRGNVMGSFAHVISSQ